MTSSVAYELFSTAFRRVFEVVLQRCVLEGLVGGEGFAIDASVIKADANRERFVAAADGKKLAEDDSGSRAVREYLDALDANNPAGPNRLDAGFIVDVEATELLDRVIRSH